ncbi:ParB/RepB/Spo0J family partition protein [Lactiplantibacillus mudanjiangensis]|uniref:Chromosome partitioning protein, DNA-binding protein [Lactobacillus plantarum JDM1] n=1 Tax=Lactiplantibacillus mudanjiangensis TaxID=1296538 RepID=A0A660DV99_9LACO|nr:ParB/RepB/Spo0J family partition protein [Lactiplantibacillus mudanjiangensis]VDG20310.1 chromosome partitioning protein, DNA-binding protein [Lactobacillus plantarum JDM1] [Lactiplantibacillus mudanjiangensis]VDG23997.1 chromosome partitioning protein, DNA-binding protein [Lactobacillus plantarum JDM1] [Lactiplantibacillus mudanjiangensis]VDG27226.1 chromosome partitioning protein, DNA-binding protein [Lactobacillus plantarum JDM1] [Lactiplantibacillus mudanjiangensis]VDG33914.1 chromosome 
MASKDQNKALGRGIDALFADVDEPVSEAAVVDLALTDIRANPYQPRQKFDQTALKELASSIEKSGVFQPIIVRQPDAEIKKYEIIAGERRFRASKLAKQTTIPAIVREVTEAEMMEVAVLENLQREDLTPLEEAEAYDSLMKKLKLTQAEVSKRLGKSRPYIANYLRLLGLPAAVKQLIQKGQLSMGQARTLLSLKDKTKLAPLAKKAVKDNLTVRQLEQIVARYNGDAQKPAKKVTVKKSPYIRASEEQLQERFGTAVSIQAKANQKDQGKIEIPYLSNEDLTRILEILHVDLN